jgi:hypothetical protein
LCRRQQQSRDLLNMNRLGLNLLSDRNTTGTSNALCTRRHGDNTKLGTSTLNMILKTELEFPDKLSSPVQEYVYELFPTSSRNAPVYRVTNVYTF